MIKKEGKAPANARVDVIYEKGKKPKIKFSYPKLTDGKGKPTTIMKDAEHQNSVGIHTLIIFFVLILALSGIYLSYYEYPTYPDFCNVTLEEVHYGTNITYDGDLNASVYFREDRVTGADFYCDNGNYSVYFNTQPDIFGFVPPNFMASSDPVATAKALIKLIVGIAAFLYILIIINRFVTKKLVRSPRYQKWLPEHNVRQRHKKYWKFTAKDFDPETSPFVEVPNFKNISIEYRCHGDFSKQLKKIKIREHKYHKYDTKKEEVGKLKVEILKWTSRFYFDKVPKDGYMEVIYY